MSSERIEEYKLVTSDNATELSSRVTELINEGWQPHCGPTHSDSPRIWAQAVVRVSRFPKRPLSRPLAETKRA